MPRRDDLQRILIIGAGPIVIGQACEFDYSGTQACKALREEGYEVLLVNSNPATIMTDPEFADRTYIEPVNVDTVARIIERERPDAILPTMGGQTALNVAVGLHEAGVLEKFGVEMIGAKYDVIQKAEDRDLFKKAMEKVGAAVPPSGIAYTLDEAREVVSRIGLPCVIRPAFTLGGSGGGIAYNPEEFERIVNRGLELSRNSEVLIEKSIAGWKEFELEVMRDRKDNVVIVCSIENLDPMGVHTGDSITVAPQQTLTDREYQEMRDESLAIIREIGVETGGSNIQFATNPENGDRIVIEVNPRVSRSSALASKATGFPIAKMAAKLAVGYSLDEIPNDITKETPACFEPSIDYVVVKMPRFAFEKFPEADDTLGTQMKAVGETMAIGRNFKEALQKAMRGLETGDVGFGLSRKDPFRPGAPRALMPGKRELRKQLAIPTAERIQAVRHGLLAGLTEAEVHDASRIDPWFVRHMADTVKLELEMSEFASFEDVPASALKRWKSAGFSDVQLANHFGTEPARVRTRRRELGILPVFKRIDTCAAEFESYTPYLYSTYESECEVVETPAPKIMVIGGGPNRIGQGIEFDYCCVQACIRLREQGYEIIMVNSNPETVSTDFDTSDQLFFEPVTVEDVLHIHETQAVQGAIVQFGGQTPLNISLGLKRAGVTILGTSPEAIDLVEDREKFKALLERLDIRQPESRIAVTAEGAEQAAAEIGYPLVVRPSYVLGGRGMEIVYDRRALVRWVEEATEASPDHPILIDRFLENAIEVDVDAVYDGKRFVIGGIMEHVEPAGIHSGDSTSILPPHSLPDAVVDVIRDHTARLAEAVGVLGLMNVQYAVKDGEVYVIEVNPRASRTVPFVSKAIGISLAGVAARVMAGESLEEIGFTEEIVPEYWSVKAPVFPFTKFPGTDIVLGPEMKSTGEVMGIDANLGCAVYKAFDAASRTLPLQGTVFVSVCNRDKESVADVARAFHELGFKLLATPGTQRSLESQGIPAATVFKRGEGRPDVVDVISNHEVHLVINSPSNEPEARVDEKAIRTAALLRDVPTLTSVFGARIVATAVESMRRSGMRVRSMQEFHEELQAARAT
ncbi:MAG: carbamoyl-phosphate synthase (glutamine-hydrolyzing) [Planctomycetota bacterium]|nr:MAG: carbamoyl-phosphate synthase (glutamine-hydrolyzing) [Planctomycetota bacterium]